MNRPLKVGDLVCVVKPTPCCGSTKLLGKVFTITKLGWSKTGLIECGTCGKERKAVALTAKGEKKRSIDSSRLKRIPPLAELESVEREAVV